MLLPSCRKRDSLKSATGSTGYGTIRAVRTPTVPTDYNSSEFSSVILIVQCHIVFILTSKHMDQPLMKTRCWLISINGIR